MRKIYGIGETVLDIIIKNGQPQAAKAGGSVLNSAVSMGRMGLPVYFMSEYASDDAGKLVDEFLRQNGVDTSFVQRYSDGNTTIALAFLNKRNDASYTFYKNPSSKRLDLNFPVISEDDILQCGSFYAITPEIRDRFVELLHYAKEKGALVLYDPNFRKSHLDEVDMLRPVIIENMDLAFMVRGSDEDFRNIFGVTTPDEAWQIVKSHCDCLVYTASSEGVHVRTKSYSGKFPVHRITPVSTIGAGDNFNAGMLTAIYRKDLGKEDLLMMDRNGWNEIITTAVAFATHVCLSYENYISMEFAHEMLSR